MLLIIAGIFAFIGLIAGSWYAYTRSQTQTLMNKEHPKSEMPVP